MAGPVVPVDVDEVEQVWRWRYAEFRRMGFDEVDSEYLADSHADLHEAEALVTKKHCPPTLAAEILT